MRALRVHVAVARCLIALGLGRGLALAAPRSRPAGVPLAHPLPRWPHTYNMSLSTIIMPCDYSKFIDDPTIRKFGVVDLDWRATWKPQAPQTHTPLLTRCQF